MASHITSGQAGRRNSGMGLPDQANGGQGQDQMMDRFGFQGFHERNLD